MKSFFFIILTCFGVLRLKATTFTTDDLVLPNGTLNLMTGFTGTLNIAGWYVILDPIKGPILHPKPPLTWNPLNKGLNKMVTAMAISGTDVYVGGWFTGVGIDGSTVADLNYIAKWNGITWSALDKGLNNRVNTIAVNGTDVYVGGDFNGTTFGGAPVTGLNYIAKWNGTAWSALGKGLNSQVNVITVNGTNLYVGGFFTAVGTGGTPTTGLNYIAKWNGISWSALDKGLNSAVGAICVSGTNLYIGGNFTDVGLGGMPTTGLNYIAVWDGSVWSALDKGLNRGVSTIVVSGVSVYVGGIFTGVGMNGNEVIGLNKIAKWNGTTWSALDYGLNDDVGSIAVIGNDLYVGGLFTKVDFGGIWVDGLNAIAKWNGTAWSALDKGLSGGVLKLMSNGADLYVGGNFATVAPGGTSVSGISCIAIWKTNAVPVEQVSNALVSIKPTLVNNILTIDGASRYEIFNMIGQSMLQSIDNQLNVQNLLAGNYLIHGFDTQGHFFAAKFVKQ